METKTSVMILNRAPSAIIIKKLPEHKAIKHELLSHIQSMGVHSSTETGTQVSNTDWYMMSRFKRVYVDIFYPSITSFYEEVEKELKLPLNHKLRLQNIWFQKYNKGYFHTWHMHPEALYSSVYYLELPEGSSKTSFKFLDEEFEFDVEEGDIILFPGSYVHCSKPNATEKTKTVISFNTNLAL